MKKFGTFGGVFTPSILTILGVIMYMRLPWIVGQSGLFLAVGIILVAHVISVTTGLSVSSIATDKKVKAGGTYYIISRSLGLPIGGTLGIALFFGLSLSVSLYIIGFSESFLGFWDFPINKDTIRIAGTIALIAVGTLTFISTSLAIKTQYFIMTAIILSLVTIFFGKHDFQPVEPLLNPIENAAPLILLFAIFFPAVTGFEAGVSMSGDLENPKKSIPVGTIAAIALGLIVYIGLAAFFAYTVNSDQLINNPNILLEISFYPPLLVAGIWGATISSAIGSILGAPRILQATSSDRITPKIFAKGFGPTNEPRNALLLTFVIAEAGILIGELNLIARVVSMFFITTYGFLNLSSTIEKLTSTDFRPSFKIPAWVSIVGALVSFILMLELDFIALIGATIIMGAIFIYLKNKELTLESGDTWEGVWSSILRSGLNKLNSTVKQQRNWRPNIILFSGGHAARPHLIEFGRWLVKKRGILSNFNLIENKNSTHLIKKNPSDPNAKKKDFEGIFAREMEVNDIYEGMETITKVYGFAGIEPNSVMFGWARGTKDRLGFSKLLRMYQKLDYNIFILDYCKEIGFGKNKTIDLWWRGSGNNANFALTLIKFLQMEDDWSDVEARIFIITNETAIHNRVYRNVTQILDDQRINATLKVINNSIDNKPFDEIIKLESKNTDLVILGLPEIEKDEDIIEKTDKVIESLNTVLLVYASTFFKPLYIGIENTIVTDEKLDLFHQENITNSIVLPQNEILADAVKKISENFDNGFNTIQQDYLSKIIIRNKKFIENYYDLTERSFNEFDSIISAERTQKSRKIAAKIVSNYLFSSKTIAEEFKNNIIPEQNEFLTLGLQTLQSQLESVVKNVPEELTYFKEKNAEQLEKENKILKSLGLIKDETKIKFNLLIQHSSKYLEKEIVFPLIGNFAFSNYQLVSSWQKLSSSINDSLNKLEDKYDKGELKLSELENEQKNINQKFQTLIEEYKNNNQTIFGKQKIELKNFIQAISDEIQNENVNKIISVKKSGIKKLNLESLNFPEIPNNFERNQKLIVNFLLKDIVLRSFENRISKILEKNLQELLIFIDSNYLNILEEIEKSISTIQFKDQKQLAFRQTPEILLNTNEIVESLLNDFESAIKVIPESFEIMSEESFQNLEMNQFGEISTIEINLHKYLNFTIETELVDPIQKGLSEISIQLGKTKDITNDVIRFTNYNLSQIGQSIEQSDESFNSIIKQSIHRLKNEKTAIELKRTLLIENYKKFLSNTVEKLNPYLISRSVGEFKQTIRAKEGREMVLGFRDYVNRTQNYFKNGLVHLVYKQSEGVLFAKKIGEQVTSYQTETGKILNVVNQLTPNRDILNSLPFYYKQLFLGKHFRSKEFLIRRENEFKKAANAIENYKNGYKGGLLILGEPHSGKSTLSNAIANKHFDAKKIIRINPLDSGSVSLEDFEKQLAYAFNQIGIYDINFSLLQNGTAVIIDDLELWWERSKQGLTVINKIVELIEKYSEKCFFIVNCGTDTFKFINRLRSIENIFISAVQCEPFDAEEIQEAILLRHKSSGFKFELDKQNEDQISKLRLAKLFNSYFDISKGNIGLAILNWVSNISKIKSMQITIEKPDEVKDYFLDNLSTDWFVLLQQFVLHKQLNLFRISRILGFGETDTFQSIEYLKRSGLVVEFQKNIYHINPYVHNLISKKLANMDLL